MGEVTTINPNIALDVMAFEFYPHIKGNIIFSPSKLIIILLTIFNIIGMNKYFIFDSFAFNLLSILYIKVVRLLVVTLPMFHHQKPLFGDTIREYNE